MMREILFRGKCYSSLYEHENIWLKWLYGSLQTMPDGRSLIYDSNKTQWINVDPETVGQYTGLKDKNGVKIFEGDYLLCAKFIGGNWVEHICERGYVEYKHGAFGLHRKEGYYRSFQCWLEDYDYEVIGNIHDNPELLEGTE